jgi:hypothetical protein
LPPHTATDLAGNGAFLIAFVSPEYSLRFTGKNPFLETGFCAAFKKIENNSK